MLPAPHSRFAPPRTLLAILGLFLMIYLCDLAWYELRLRFPSLGPVTSSVHRLRILAIPRKANKIEYQVDALRPEEDLLCSRSLFPHAGAQPCWYVTKHAHDPISM